MEKNELLKTLEDLPYFFGPSELRKIFGWSKNKVYSLVHHPGFPKTRKGRHIVICKPHFMKWVEEEFTPENEADIF